ncbi:right-handed parallel beta-helix repeat-containing protein [Bacillus sp. UNC41MFS5]|uniref:right-handed parallel beta-helix repeat-containing protein n=1 Tax=Bacillus sp. UNC41MFS5 TaxID=1449046 RepID=UPI00068AB8A7|nr:right-handed parallel beta-helix repeat-containing protein [Bacillus sp. UNC41MFS5]
MKALTKIRSVLLALLFLCSSIPAANAEETGGNQEPAQNENLVWQSVTFGQSTDLNFAANVLPEKIGTNYAAPEKPGTIEGKITLESRGGKLAPGHDGLIFYYTKVNPNIHNFVLEADMTIEQFGPETGAGPNGQESAGIMVRDTIGAPRQDPMILGYEEVPAASNVFGVGMMRNGVAPIYRTGVLYPWGNLGSQLKASPFTTDSQYKIPVGTPVKVRLERTDTEFIMSATFTHLAEEKIFEQRVKGADLVQVMDKDHMYVGFYAARNAKMTIQNAKLTLSEAHTVPTPPTEPVPDKPAMSLLSAPESGSQQYDLKALANYKGTISVVKDGEEVVSGAAVQKDEVYSFSTLLDNGTTDFTVTYTPSEGPSTAPITKNITVTKKIYTNGAGLFVSPKGTSSAKGTIDDPVDLETAIKFAIPGETIYMREGVYTPASIINIKKEYSGSKEKVKTLMVYNGEKVVIDGHGKLGNVLQLNGDYWRLFGIQITKASSSGMRVSGDHNVVEQMLFNYNGDTGLQISGSSSNPDFWPKYNLILNCESHDNRDISDENADGFAAKLGVGVGNVFRGNIAHHNIDDGWDLYNRTNEGANMPITLEGNIAYANGKLSNGYNEDGNAGNGFKLGGEGLPVAHIVRNNIAFDNNMDGFTDNFNPGKMVVENNTAFNNKRFNYVFRINPYFTAEEQGTFKNNLSYRTASGAVKDFISGKNDRTNFFYDGSKTSNNEGIVVSSKELVNLEIPSKFERDIDGNILYGSFLRISPDSFLNSADTNKSYVGALPADPVSLELKGPDALREGESAKLVVVARFFNGSEKVLSSGIQFKSEDIAIAAVDRGGNLQAGEKGKTTITAFYHGLEAKLDIHVKKMPPGLK